jgi:hypothetical protein
VKTDPDAPNAKAGEWSVDFHAAEEHALDASFAATPSQRLAWLEEALAFALRVGALPRPDVETGERNGIPLMLNVRRTARNRPWKWSTAYATRLSERPAALLRSPLHAELVPRGGRNPARTRTRHNRSRHAKIARVSGACGRASPLCSSE